MDAERGRTRDGEIRGKAGEEGKGRVVMGEEKMKEEERKKKGIQV